MIDCQGGQITLAGRVIHDDKAITIGVITGAQGAGAIERRGRRQARAEDGPGQLLPVHSRLRLRQPLRRRAARRNARPAAPSEQVGIGSSIGSIAIGQEVGVTPLQLVSMVSTIANGGVYLPPHVLMPSQLDAAIGQKPAAPQAAQPFKPGEELPNPLPAGAHRVISTMTAAQMRKMMEGVVLFGTGKPAQLNGYSSGGKTGTAQKIDPATHLYSKTMHIASFAGFAPVNNPVIAVAVVIDNPKRRVLLRHRGLRAGLRRSGAAGARIPGRSARHRSAPSQDRLKQAKAEKPDTGRRLGCGPDGSQCALRCRQRSARRRSAAPATAGSAQPAQQTAAQPDESAQTAGDEAERRLRNRTAVGSIRPALRRRSDRTSKLHHASATARNSACPRSSDCPSAR